MSFRHQVIGRCELGFESARTLRTFDGHEEGVSAVALSPDGCRAVSASHDRTLRIWDLETGQLVRNLQGHTGSVQAVALMPDGHRAISVSHDRTLRVLDLETGQTLRTLDGHTEDQSRFPLWESSSTRIGL